MRVFIYEAICAGALGNDVPASLRREGSAMLSAVAEDFRRLPGIEVVTLLDDDARFREVAAACEGTLVIAPEFDDLLRSRSQTVVDVGGRLLGSLPNAIRLTGDKLATAEFWRMHGVAHPQTELRESAVAPPWVLKPRHGAGSQATFLIRDRAEYDTARRTANEESPGGEYILQRYVAGHAVSVALLIGPTRTIPLLPARQHLSNDGRFRYEGGSLPLPEPLATRAILLAQEAVAGIAGLQGYVGVDLVLGETEDYAIEINPRLTTSYIGLRQLCQQNLAELMLRCARGEPIGPVTWAEGEVRFHVAAL
jgi:predicted ATP-grasp superfamily ATP-dependent carboligase